MQRTDVDIKDIRLHVENDHARYITTFAMRIVVTIEADGWGVEKCLVVQHSTSTNIVDVHIRDAILRELMQKAVHMIKKERDAIEQRLQGIHTPEQVRKVLAGENTAREVARDLRTLSHSYDSVPAGVLKGYLEGGYFGGVRPTYGSGSGTFNAGHDDGWAGTTTG